MSESRRPISVTILACVYLLVASAWIGFHLVVSAFHPVRELVIHAILFLVIPWISLAPSSPALFPPGRTCLDITSVVAEVPRSTDFLMCVGSWQM